MNRLSIAARLARRELRSGLRNGLQGFRIFLACVILGVAAIAAIGTLRMSIATGLQHEGAALLGGDAELEFTYRRASEDERAWMQSVALQSSEIIDFRSLAVTPEGTRGLTQIKAVDANYPLLGRVGLSPDMPLPEALKGKDGLPGAVMHPLLIDKLGLEIGNVFRLGTQDFRLMARLINEPDNATGGFTLGPRSIVASSALSSSGLITPGTLFSSKYRLKLPQNTDLAALQKDAQTRLENSGLRWRDARNGAPGVAQFINRLGAFLVLVGLSGLAVGGVGISAALRAYLTGKTRVIATLRTLGADQRIIILTYFLQISLLAFIGLIAGIVLGVGLPILLAPLLEARLPVPALFAIYPGPMFEALLYSILTILIFTLWPLARAQEVRAATLFRDALSQSRALPRWPYLLVTVALVLLMLAAAAGFSGNARLTFWTTGGIASALVILALAAFLIRRMAHHLRPRIRGFPALKWALAAIGGPRSSTGPVLLSLGLGLSVLAAIGQIDGNLRGAISRDLPTRAPAFFFVDLQQDQIPGFLDRLKNDSAVTRIDSAPMLRGIITGINGQPARDVAGDHWVLNGDRGVSYAGPLPKRAKITAGEWWDEAYDGPPQISFSAKEAAEMGLSIGDKITVNILGRDITATLSSLRQVNFSTAGIGFIMVMNQAALQAAPHSFIATVYAHADAEAAILRDISDMFPNVTAIRVRDAIERVASLLEGLAAAIAWGAAATVLTGFLVLIGAAAADQATRSYEAAILKTLGASRGQILLSIALRAVLLGLAAGAVSLAAGILGGWAVSHYIMETRFQVIWPSAIMIIISGIAVNLLAGLAFARGPLSARPARILRAME